MADLLAWLTGGRPMMRTDFAFTDVVSGKPVYRWRDAYGRYWLAEHAWSGFRVEATRPAYDAAMHADFHAGAGS